MRFKLECLFIVCCPSRMDRSVCQSECGEWVGAEGSERHRGLEPDAVLDVRAVLVVAETQGIRVGTEPARQRCLQIQAEAGRPADRKACPFQLDGVGGCDTGKVIVLVHSYRAPIEAAHDVEYCGQALARLEVEQHSFGA